MKYITIFDPPHQNQVTIIRNLFEQNQMDFRILDDSTNNAVPVGAKIQVEERDVQRAKKILKENGFLGTPQPGPRSRLNVRFLWYLLIALILVVVISVLVNQS